MQSFYSKNSKEPRFGSFVRMVIGLPFLKPSDLERGIKNIEKQINMFKVKKCIDFGKTIVAYLTNFWMKLDLDLLNMFNVKTRTNNNAEGYNSALASKKVLGKHPNPYTLVSTIKDELRIAYDTALSEIMAKSKKKISYKYKKIRERQDKLMEAYSRGNIELSIYQVTIGNACLRTVDQITTDLGT